MLKFPIPAPLDPKEAALIERRRRYEAERRSRIFNDKKRLFGIDKQSLEEQVSQRKAREESERQKESEFEGMMVHHSQLALSCERKIQEEKRRLMKDLNEFRANCQRPQDSASYELNRPDRLKLKDDNVIYGISSAQVFEGEDCKHEQRLELQRKKQRDWLDLQLREKEAADTARRHMELSQECATLLMDEIAVKLDQAEQEARRLQQETLVQFNKALIAEKEACRHERERLELLDKQAEMTNCITGDFLTENPDVAQSALGSHRLIPDRWKGMSPEQREKIRMEQLKQAEEEKKRRYEEKMKNSQWEAHINEMDRYAILIDRDLMRRRREENRKLLNQNQELSQEQRAQKEHINKYAYSNVPSEAYYDQFNTSTR